MPQSESRSERNSSPTDCIVSPACGRVWGLGFGNWGLGCGLWGVGCGV